MFDAHINMYLKLHKHGIYFRKNNVYLYNIKGFKNINV